MITKCTCDYSALKFNRFLHSFIKMPFIHITAVRKSIDIRRIFTIFMSEVDGGERVVVRVKVVEERRELR